MSNNDRNPLHSPHIQALRQLLQHGYDGTLEDILEQLEEESTSAPNLIKKMTEEWNAIRYASKSIDHLMLSTFDYYPQIHRASPEAQAVLLLMLRTQEQATGLVEVPKGVYAKVLQWGSKRAGRISDCLTELQTMQVISPVYEPPDGSRQPGIYQINPKFSKIGKGFQVQPIDTKTAGDYIQFPHTVTIAINGVRRTLKCGSIHQVIRADKKKSASAGHTGTSEQSTQGGSTINQDNDKQSTTKNQEKSSYTFNMQNGMTAEEAKLFSPEGDEQPENPAYSIHNDTTKEE